MSGCAAMAFTSYLAVIIGFSETQVRKLIYRWLHYPDKRVCCGEWCDVLDQACDVIHDCSAYCGQNFYGIKAEESWRYNNVIVQCMRFRFIISDVIINADTGRYPHHTGTIRPSDFSTPIVQDAGKPTDPGSGGLNNASVFKWTYADDIVNLSAVEPYHVNTVKPGRKIRF